MGARRGYRRVLAFLLILLHSHAVHGQAGQEESWLPVLRQVLAADRKCDLASVLWAREVPVGGAVALEGRVRCYDGREFDFSRPRPHMKFEVRLCLPTVC
jgi:hypothetical protein